MGFGVVGVLWFLLGSFVLWLRVRAVSHHRCVGVWVCGFVGVWACGCVCVCVGVLWGIACVRGAFAGALAFARTIVVALDHVRPHRARTWPKAGRDKARAD